MNCVVVDGDAPDRTAGVPETRFMFFPTSAAEVMDTWNVTGLRGTGSQDFRVADVFVPGEHATAGFALSPVQPGALYRIPLLSLSSCSLAAVSLGIARAAIAALIELGAAKTPRGSMVRLGDQPGAQAALGRAEALVRAARAGLFDALHQRWRSHGASPPSTASAPGCGCRARIAPRHVLLPSISSIGPPAPARSSRTGRSRAASATSTPQRSMSVSSGGNYEHAGRVLFGREPGPRY